MEPTHENELDSLIARIDGNEADPAAATAADPDPTQETVTDDAPDSSDVGGVDEGGAGEADGDAPDGDAEVEVNPADLTPLAAPTTSATPEAELAARLAAAERQLGEHTAFRKQLEEAAEKAKAAEFLETLRGMDPEDRYKALAEHAARHALSVQQQLESLQQAQQQREFEARETADKQRVMSFIATGGRKTADGRFVLDKKRALTDAEVRRLAFIASAEDMERYADDCLAERRGRTAAARAANTARAAASGVTATTSGVATAPAPEQAPQTLDELIDRIFAA